MSESHADRMIDLLTLDGLLEDLERFIQSHARLDGGRTDKNRNRRLKSKLGFGVEKIRRNQRVDDKRNERHAEARRKRAKGEIEDELAQT